MSRHFHIEFHNICGNSATVIVEEGMYPYSPPRSCFPFCLFVDLPYVIPKNRNYDTHLADFGASKKTSRQDEIVLRAFKELKTIFHNTIKHQKEIKN